MEAASLRTQKRFLQSPDVDGGLIGGAALKCADFKGIIDAWKA